MGRTSRYRSGQHFGRRAPRLGRWLLVLAVRGRCRDRRQDQTRPHRHRRCVDAAPSSPAVGRGHRRARPREPGTCVGRARRRLPIRRVRDVRCGHRTSRRAHGSRRPGVERDAWTGEPFEFGGQTVRVTPRPHQRPRPPILLAGSSIAAAKRAARIADGFVPSSADLVAEYRNECERLGKDPGPAPTSAEAVLIALVHRDPDVGWKLIADTCACTT